MAGELLTFNRPVGGRSLGAALQTSQPVAVNGTTLVVECDLVHVNGLTTHCELVSQAVFASVGEDFEMQF